MPKTNDLDITVDQIVAVPSEEKKRSKKQGLKIDRYFTTPGVHPFDEIEWEGRDAAIYNEKGETIFQQKGVETPKNWSMQICF